MTATIKFPAREQAEIFATNWSRYSKLGHTIGSGTKNVTVDVYNISEDQKIWIDNYIANINSKK